MLLLSRRAAEEQCDASTAGWGEGTLWARLAVLVQSVHEGEKKRNDGTLQASQHKLASLPPPTPGRSHLSRVLLEQLPCLCQSQLDPPWLVDFTLDWKSPWISQRPQVSR